MAVFSADSRVRGAKGKSAASLPRQLHPRKIRDCQRAKLRQAVGLREDGGNEPRPSAWAGMSQTFGLVRRSSLVGKNFIGWEEFHWYEPNLWFGWKKFIGWEEVHWYQPNLWFGWKKFIGMS